jgi:hypothetical protein
MKVSCIKVPFPEQALTWGRQYGGLEIDETNQRVLMKADDGRAQWFPDYCFDLKGNARSLQSYTVWLEAEHWEPGSWNPVDTNTDVDVTFADGTSWVATFFTYANIATLRARYQESGECLSGKYFWASDMLLVGEVSRLRIEAVIDHLLKECEFERIFTRLPVAEGADTGLPQE